MKKTWILSALLTLGPVCWAQQADKFPLGEYEELTDTKPHDDAEVWDRMPAATELSWGTTDIRYKKLDVPEVKKSTRWKTKAWKSCWKRFSVTLPARRLLKAMSSTSLSALPPHNGKWRW